MYRAVIQGLKLSVPFRKFYAFYKKAICAVVTRNIGGETIKNKFNKTIPEILSFI